MIFHRKTLSAGNVSKKLAALPRFMQRLTSGQGRNQSLGHGKRQLSVKATTYV